MSLDMTITKGEPMVGRTGKGYDWNAEFYAESVLYEKDRLHPEYPMMVSVVMMRLSRGVRVRDMSVEKNGIASTAAKRIYYMCDLLVDPSVTHEEWHLLDSCLLQCHISKDVTKVFTGEVNALVTKKYGDARKGGTSDRNAKNRRQQWERAMGSLVFTMQSIPSIEVPLLSRSEAQAFITDLKKGRRELGKLIVNITEERDR